jgi:hypothetical protein
MYVKVPPEFHFGVYNHEKDIRAVGSEALAEVPEGWQAGRATGGGGRRLLVRSFCE